MISYPELRLRRLRKTSTLRTLVRQTEVSARNLIYPIFVTHGRNIRKEIPPMPGCLHLSLDHLLKEITEIVELGISGVIVFGLPEQKNDLGTEAYNENGIVQKAVKLIKRSFPDLIVITDVCLCQYTRHGHCGILDGNYIDNDASLELYAKTAVTHSNAGADMIAPSGMMDGQIKAIRTALDYNKFELTPIMSYAAKFSSSFYGPFRTAADSLLEKGDRNTHQIDPANQRMAIQEIQADIVEGADIIMVKPALSYLDIVSKARDLFNHPIAAYNVSGEYSMVKAAAREGWIDEKSITIELLTSIKRAGADIIITYHAKDMANWLSE